MFCPGGGTHQSRRACHGEVRGRRGRQQPVAMATPVQSGDLLRAVPVYELHRHGAGPVQQGGWNQAPERLRFGVRDMSLSSLIWQIVNNFHWLFFFHVSIGNH